MIRAAASTTANAATGRSEAAEQLLAPFAVSVPVTPSAQPTAGAAALSLQTPLDTGPGASAPARQAGPRPPAINRASSER